MNERRVWLDRLDSGMIGQMYAHELRNIFHGFLHRRGSRCPVGKEDG